ncbi:gliding motility protein [Thermaurantimonas aggregans]|uniref:Gliding motility protein n=1 Tax=Thermaurantimonas aggregans TaxID=2173829 RepID=A0A401XL10_9FLAO|nr:tetratricopeptide repeat protein [Thermaurantimonas aggregans]GCD77692.1 gliding motility protein [Thermaurantimonas aggregans]
MGKFRSNYLIILLSGVVLLAACSRTRDTWASRTYHQITAKYNPLFNAEQALLKAKTTVKQQSKLSFDTLVPLYLVTPEQMVSMIDADIKRANEKATKTIREHTMVIAGKQKNKTIKNAYFVLGEAYYTSRDFYKAIEIFNFIAREYADHPIVIDAEIYSIKSQTQLGNYYAAREIANKYYKSKNLKKKQQIELLKAMAANEIPDKKYELARRYLQEALTLKPSMTERINLMYLIAQLYELEGNYFEANKMFRKIIKSSPPYIYQINAYLRMAANYDPNLMQSAEMLSDLYKLTKKDKNRDYLDAIYYQIADIYIKDENFDKAFEALQKSINYSTENNIQKGLSYIRRGDLHFDFREYVPAEANYDSALIVLPKTHFRYSAIEKKKNSLTELVQHLNVIAYEDSVLRLAALDKRELDKVIDRIIQQAKKADEEAQRERQVERDQPSMAGRNTPPATPTPAAGGMMGLNAPGAPPTFYFYNQALVAQGFTEFTNRWGNRKLEDDWRRKNKEITSTGQSTASGDGSSEGNTQGSDDIKESDNPKYKREYYYARIPSTSDSLEAAHKRIRNAHEAAARIYKDVLNDPKEAIKMLENLLKRYPDCDCTPRVYYTLCLIAQNQSLTLKKEAYCDGLIKKFPESSYAALLTGKGQDTLYAQKTNVQELQEYKAAYQAYKSSKYSAAAQLVKEAIKKYPNSEMTPKWRLLDALVSAKTDSKDSLKAKLESIVATYPQSPEATEAQNILKHLSGEGSAAIGSSAAASEFIDAKSAPHQYMLVLENKGIDLNTIRSTISNFNTSKFPNSRLQLRNILMGREYQLILVSGFNNQAEALQYLQEINKDMDFIAYIPKPNHQVVITSDNFRKFYQKQLLKEYIAFYEKYINLPSNPEKK